MPPGYHPEWHIGVRVAANKKLVAFISGVPITVRVRKKYTNFFLFCVLFAHYLNQRFPSKRDQLSLRSQETSIKAPSPSAYQGSYSTVPFEGNFPSTLHGGCSDPNSCINMQVRTYL